MSIATARSATMRSTRRVSAPGRRDTDVQTVSVRAPRFRYTCYSDSREPVDRIESSGRERAKMTDDRARDHREPELAEMPTGQLPRPAGLTLEVAGRTDKGRVRPGNEDAFVVEPPMSVRARAHGT